MRICGGPWLRVPEYLELGDAKRKGFGDLLLNTEDDFHKYILEYNGLSVMPTFKRVANPLGMLNSHSARVHCWTG